MSFVILFIYHWVIFCNISPFQLSVLSVFTFVLRYFLIYICIPFPRFFDVVRPVSSVLTSRMLHAKCGRNLDSCGVWKSHSAPTYGSPLQLLPVHFQSELHVLSFFSGLCLLLLLLFLLRPLCPLCSISQRSPLLHARFDSPISLAPLGRAVYLDRSICIPLFPYKLPPEYVISRY